MTALTLSIVSHGHEALLRRLLGQLDQQPSLAGTRVVVTLNLADEPFDATPYQSLHIVVRRNEVPLGFGANHNAAFASCDTPWFGVLNPDLSILEREPFSAALALGQAHEDIGVVAPRVLGGTGAPEDSVRANLTPWSLLRRRLLGDRGPELREIAKPGSTFFWVAGMCLLLPSDAYRRVGGFDERFFLYCEDYDLCARLYNQGYAIAVVPDACIVHEAQRDSHRSLRHLRWHLVSLLRVWTSAAFWRVTLKVGRRSLAPR